MTLMILESHVFDRSIFPDYFVWSEMIYVGICNFSFVSYKQIFHIFKLWSRDLPGVAIVLNWMHEGSLETCFSSKRVRAEQQIW